MNIILIKLEAFHCHLLSLLVIVGHLVQLFMYGLLVNLPCGLYGCLNPLLLILGKDIVTSADEVFVIMHLPF
jgi:hypothetical protein